MVKCDIPFDSYCDRIVQNTKFYLKFVLVNRDALDKADVNLRYCLFADVKKLREQTRKFVPCAVKGLPLGDT